MAWNENTQFFKALNDFFNIKNIHLRNRKFILQFDIIKKHSEFNLNIMQDKIQLRCHVSVLN